MSSFITLTTSENRQISIRKDIVLKVLNYDTNGLPERMQKLNIGMKSSILIDTSSVIFQMDAPNLVSSNSSILVTQTHDKIMELLNA